VLPTRNLIHTLLYLLYILFPVEQKIVYFRRFGSGSGIGSGSAFALKAEFDIKRYNDGYLFQDQKYDALKAHAEEKLEEANREIENISRAQVCCRYVTLSSIVPRYPVPGKYLPEPTESREPVFVDRLVPPIRIHQFLV
jgi:hypothetical protein